MFPDCKIILYDNESTDNSVEIALSWANVEIRTYKTGNKLSDQTYLDLKNNIWKRAETDWVLIADIDEHLQITQEQLKSESNCSIIKAHGFNMVNHQDNFDIDSITKFVRAPSYDKYYLFNKSKITDINYLPGCHRADPKGVVIFSKNIYPCRHYKYINVDYIIERHALFAARMSDDNKKRGWGVHYENSPEEIRKEFEMARTRSLKHF